MGKIRSAFDLTRIGDLFGGELRVQVAHSNTWSSADGGIRVELFFIVGLGVLLGIVVRGSVAAVTLLVCTIIVEFALFFSVYNLDFLRIAGLFVATGALQLATVAAFAFTRDK